MKKICRNILSFLLTFGMALSLSIPAFAAEPTVTYQGQEKGFAFEPGSSYSESDLFDSFKGVMPGDTRTETITFFNEATDNDFVKLYLKVVPHDETENPLSDAVAESGETIASMQEFLSKLSMKVYQGDSLIYEASPDQTDGLANAVYLGTVRSGEKTALRVELNVPIELDNQYANRIGEMDWVFTVEAFNESQLTVRKVWSDGYEAHQNDSITVNLLKDGKVAETQTLSAENGWVYTFDKLLEGHEWTVEEAAGLQGYIASYKVDGTTTTITNTGEEPVNPGTPLNITVRKEWAQSDKEHPGTVNVTLYDGDKAVETVQLNAQNNWTYTWKDSDRLGNWQVLETSIPKGFTPSYRVKDGVLVITNTATLIQTGQSNRLMITLGSLGVLLAMAGMIIVLKQRKKQS